MPATNQRRTPTDAKRDTIGNRHPDPARFGEFRLIRLTREQEAASIAALNGVSDSLIDDTQPFLTGCSFSKATKAVIRASNGVVQGLLFHNGDLVASTIRKTTTIEGVYMFDAGGTQYDVEVSSPISLATYDATQRYGRHGEHMR